jgi:hypothetical protein
VLDVNLRGDAIYPLAEALRHRGVPFVLATGYDPIRESYRSVACWEKPFDARALASAFPALARQP